MCQRSRCRTQNLLPALHTKADCPEIDGSVLTPADTPLETGAFYKVTITDSDTYDLYGYAEERLED